MLDDFHIENDIEHLLIGEHMLGQAMSIIHVDPRLGGVAAGDLDIPRRGVDADDVCPGGGERLAQKSGATPHVQDTQTLKRRRSIFRAMKMLVNLGLNVTPSGTVELMHRLELAVGFPPLFRIGLETRNLRGIDLRVLAPRLVKCIFDQYLLSPTGWAHRVAASPARARHPCHGRTCEHARFRSFVPKWPDDGSSAPPGTRPGSTCRRRQNRRL